MGKIKRNFKIIPGNGDLCPRCGEPTEIREHISIGARELRKDFYYSRWFICKNAACRTTTVMPERFRVYPKDRVEWSDTEVRTMAAARPTSVSTYEARNGLSLREANLLRLLKAEGATIAKGTTIAADLARRGFLTTSKNGRWESTLKGRTAVGGLTPRNP
jgi:hypothetical protein